MVIIQYSLMTLLLSKRMKIRLKRRKRWSCKSVTRKVKVTSRLRCKELWMQRCSHHRRLRVIRMLELKRVRSRIARILSLNLRNSCKLTLCK